MHRRLGSAPLDFPRRPDGMASHAAGTLLANVVIIVCRLRKRRNWVVHKVHDTSFRSKYLGYNQDFGRLVSFQDSLPNVDGACK